MHIVPPCTSSTYACMAINIYVMFNNHETYFLNNSYTISVRVVAKWQS